MNKLVFKSKDNKMIFHPGYLIKNIMDEEGKDTKGMVQLLGLTEKEITSLINAEISITDDMIDRIVKNYGTSKELWKNFQNKYDLKMKELKENSVVFNFERENEISSDIANNILNNEALDINESFIKKILSKFYPIFSKFILNFYNSIGLNNIQLPEF